MMEGLHFFEWLPTEISVMILDYCEVPHLAALSQTCAWLHERVSEEGRIKRFKALFEKGNINLFMLAAIEAGDIRLFHLAVRSGAMENRRFMRVNQYAHTSALESAAKVGNTELMQLLINKGSPLEYGLYGACESGDMALVDWFLNDARVDWGVCCRAAMDRAGQGGHSAMLKYLLKKIDESDVNARDRKDAINCGLSGACFGGHQSVAEELFALGVDELGWPLYYAVLGHHAEIVIWLEEKGSHDWERGLLAAVYIESKEWVDHFIQKIMDDGMSVMKICCAVVSSVIEESNETEEPNEMMEYLSTFRPSTDHPWW